MTGVSVIMTVLNREGQVAASIESLLRQTRLPAEIVVVNDGSTDGTGDVLANLASKHPEIVVLEHENRGIGASLHRALSAATGDAVAIADSDDRYPAMRLEESLGLMEHTGADLVGGQTDTVLGRFVRFGPSRFPTDPGSVADRFDRGMGPLPHTTMMLRRSKVESFGSYRPMPRASDLELLLRWMRQGARVAVSPAVLAEHELRWEHLSVLTQRRWTSATAYARWISALDDGDVPTLDAWEAVRSGAERRAVWSEAAARVGRLAARGVLGTTRLRR